MTDGVEASGATVEEAIDEALVLLGATEDEVEIQILAEGQPRGVFARRTQPARVRVKFRDERTPEELLEDDDEPPQPDSVPETVFQQSRAATEFVEGLLELLGMEAEVNATTSASSVLVEVTGGSDVALLIGRHGATLEALQDVVRAAVQRRTASRALVSLDIEGYRGRQRASLERRAREAATRARRTRRPVSLEPMSAYERKIVHSALTDFAGVATSSEGEEPARKVVIRPRGEAAGRGSAPRRPEARRGPPG